MTAMTAMIAMDMGAQPYTFTLLFEDGAVAVLQVHGAANQDAARALASMVLPDCTYSVRDGDRSANYLGGAFCTYSYSWTHGLAQE